MFKHLSKKYQHIINSTFDPWRWRKSPSTADNIPSMFFKYTSNVNSNSRNTKKISMRSNFSSTSFQCNGNQTSTDHKIQTHINYVTRSLNFVNDPSKISEYSKSLSNTININRNWKSQGRWRIPISNATCNINFSAKSIIEKSLTNRQLEKGDLMKRWTKYHPCWNNTEKKEFVRFEFGNDASYKRRNEDNWISTFESGLKSGEYSYRNSDNLSRYSTSRIYCCK